MIPHDRRLRRLRGLRPAALAVFSRVLAVLFPALAVLFPAMPVAAQNDSVLVFNEIMYHPAGDETALEWLELHNQMAVDLDISGWSLAEGVLFIFPEGTIVPGGGFVVVAANPAALQAASGHGGAHGPFTGRLENSGERLALLNNTLRIMDSLSYRDEGDWPVAPDGSGVSLAKIDPDMASEPAASWTVSTEVGGTPGAHNFLDPGGPGGFPAGLVSFWDCDETGSTVGDAVGGNHGSFGTGTTRVAGVVGSGALGFNNTSNAFINVGAGTGNNFSTTSGIAIEALVRPQWSGALADAEQILRKEDGTSRFLFAFQHDGSDANRDVAISPAQQPTLSFGLNVGGTYSELDMPLDGVAGRPTLADLKDGAAHHVAATYSSATGLKAIYVDGALAFSASFPPGRTITSGGASTAYIGNMSGRAEPFTGVIDEVAFWNRALSASEVAAHFVAFQAGRSYFATESDPTAPIPLSFNEQFVDAAAESWLEVMNHGAATIALANYAIVSAGTVNRELVLPAGSLLPGARRTFPESELGFDLVAGNKVFLHAPGRRRVVDAVELKDGLRGRHPEGTGRWLFPAAPTPDAANSFTFHDEVVINEIMYHHRALPATPATTVDTLLVPIDGVWRYDDSGQDLQTAWREPGFNDQLWPVGPGLLYNETAALPAPKNTALRLGPLTYYFRTEFTFDGDPAAVDLRLRPVVDDGAIFYLNGRVLYRWNMPPDPVNATTLAEAGVGDAVYSGPFDVPAADLRRGRNVLAAEVHQASAASGDIVFGTELIAFVETAPARPYGEPPESWVELHNRSSSAVDLSGWRLDRGVNFTIPPGTSLGAGGYLVIAEDRDHLAGLFPTARILGNLTGRLSNASDLIVLEDERGNPADEVRYYEGGSWSELADGGGSSLELRNARADNARGEAWAASNEASRASWRTYSYDLVAQANPGPTQWNEFVLGLLDAGEVLLDDISVLESPEGTPVQLIANGNFTAGLGGWRIIGNHRHSRLQPDPDNAANQVLRLVATGPTEHMHNHAETTLAGGRTVVNGRTYRISFRARWLGGSNQVNTRLYFNRAPATTLIDVPELNGTPGAANSRRETNIGPTFSGFGHAPVVPASGEEVTVGVEASDPDGVGAVTLWRSVNEGAWASAPMAAAGGSRYTGVLPGQNGGSFVQFYVEATDLRGAAATFPAAGRDSRALYRVADGQADLSNKHNLRLIMTTSDANFLHEPTNVMSNDRMPATVVYDERRAFYGAGVRLKGSERGRNQPGRVSFNVEFPPDNLLRGVHGTVATDRSGGYSIGISNGQDEILVKHMVARAGGIPSMYDDLIRLIAPRSAQNGSALLQMARYGNNFLDSQFENGSEGSVHEFELIYYPLTTAANGLKLPEPDNVLGVDLQNLGDGKEAYRWNFILTNNQERDDFTGLITLAKAMTLSGAALETRAAEVMDVDEWMRTFAMMSLTGIVDAYTRGNNHNLRMFIRPEDGRALALPWDWDFSFTLPTNGSLWGDQNLQKVITRPAYLHLYHGHLYDLMAKSFNTTYMSRWTAHYGSLAGANYSVFLNYIGARASFVRANLPAQVPFAITTNGGQNFTTDQGTAAIAGTAWFDVRSIVFSQRGEALDLSWATATGWNANVVLVPGPNPITLFAYDHDGGLIASDSITITSTFDPPAPTLGAITPADGLAGDVVTLSGTGLLPDVEVLFGSTPSPDVEWIDTGTAAATVPVMSAGEVNVRARNVDGDTSNAVVFTVQSSGSRFIRGDANLDGVVDISDPLRLLFHLFEEATLDCEDAADADNNEALNLADVLYLLNFTFQAGPAPPAPFPNPGSDPAAAGPLGCL